MSNQQTKNSMYMDLLSVTSKESPVRYSNASIFCTTRPLVSKLIVIQVKHCNCSSLSKDPQRLEVRAVDLLSSLSFVGGGLIALT